MNKLDFEPWLNEVKKESINIVFTEAEANQDVKRRPDWYRKQFDLGMSVQHAAERATGH
jgi:hypothetical protein